MKRRTFTAVCSLAAALPFAVAAQATYPSRPIRLVVVTGPGTAADILARYYAERLGRELKTSVVVENKVGASSIVATEFVVKAPADGYTLLFSGGPLFINHTLYEKLPFDSVRDVRMVARLASTSLVLVVPASSRFKTAKELLDYARSNPGKVNYSTAGSGSTGHLATTLLLSMAGAQATHVPYKGGDGALIGAAGGQVEMTITGISNAAGLLAGGKLRALAVTGLQRTESLPDVPTLDELGYKGYQIISRLGVMARSDTPDDIVAKLSAVSEKLVKSPEFEEFRKRNDFDSDWASAKTWEAEKQREFEYWRKAVEISGAKAN